MNRIDAIAERVDAISTRFDNLARGDAESRVAQYASLLEANLFHKDAFWNLFRQLEQDTQMTAKDKIALAKKFLGYGSYSSGTQALKSIGNRRRNLDESEAKSASRMGRSAA